MKFMTSIFSFSVNSFEIFIYSFNLLSKLISWESFIKNVANVPVTLPMVPIPVIIKITATIRPGRVEGDTSP